MIDMLAGAYIFLIALLNISAFDKHLKASPKTALITLALNTITLLIGVRLFLIGWGR